MFSSESLPAVEVAPKLCTAAQLAEWFDVSPRTILNWVKLGILPKPVRLSPRKRLWQTEEVRASIVKLETERWTVATEETNGQAI